MVISSLSFKYCINFSIFHSQSEKLRLNSNNVDFQKPQEKSTITNSVPPSLVFVVERGDSSETKTNEEEGLFHLMSKIGGVILPSRWNIDLTP
ncbi:MAG: hypothetical protein D8M57_09320 [Candidatus Scalindua sp. AMX11]|nr:MAG: hypothetical protein DWQ00_00450 [Candidatus Scalindua sp.]TDE65230.1 MAG: hypothetical protein D8M57_09320 [Candidatus Scalindua sp. AMX11]